MTAIAGIASAQKTDLVERMLKKMVHRGWAWRDILGEHVSTIDFQQERRLPNGWLLNSKEELLYYRIFKKHFGAIENLDWMGRTKGAPVA